MNVTCVSCNAPYAVDERRLPSAGADMRCPKCGTSFRIHPDGRTEAKGPPPPPPGVSKRAIAVPSPGAIRAAGSKRQVPPATPGVPETAVTQDDIAKPPSSSEIDLPALAGGPSVATDHLDLPAPVSRKASAAARPNARGASAGVAAGSHVDLPALRATRENGRASEPGQSGLDLPTPVGPRRRGGRTPRLGQAWTCLCR